VNLLSQLDWLLATKAVHVINISMGLSSGEHDANGEGHDRFGIISEILDRAVSIYQVTILFAAGNSGSASNTEGELQGGIGSGGMGYNIITVGNYDRYNNSLTDGSSYYTGNTYAKKPDIVAPGLYYFDIDYSESQIDRFACGTSFSAPSVAGVVALLMARYEFLKTSPALIKAVLMAGVKTDITHHYIPNDANYRMYGAGVMDASNAYSILQSGTYFTSSFAAMSGTIYQNMSLQENQNTRLVFAYVVETLFTDINSFDSYAYPPSFSADCVIFDPYQTAYCYPAPNVNLYISDFENNDTGNYRSMLEIFDVGGYSDTHVTSLPYAIAWFQYP
jgi:hypothetical protein